MTHSVCIGEEIDTADGKMQRTTRSGSLLAASTVMARYLLQPWPVGPFSLPQAGTRLCARSLGRPGIQPTSSCVSDRPRRPARPAGLCTPPQTATAACKLPFHQSRPGPRRIFFSFLAGKLAGEWELRSGRGASQPVIGHAHGCPPAARLVPFKEAGCPLMLA
jgi:hypothetical protein